MRIRIIQITVGIAFFFLSLGLFYTQVVQTTKYQQLSEANRIRIIPQKGSRGKILDRKGEVIADNYLSYNIAILPNKTEDITETLENLSELLEIPLEKLVAKFRREFLSMSMPVTLLDNIERQKAVMVEELKLDLPGVFLQVVPQRLYPHKRLASHLLGYLGEIDHWRLTKLKNYGYNTKDIVGYTGVEEKYDYYLRPEEGGLQVEVNHRNRIVRILGYRPAQSGRDIQLTIDLKLQQIVEEVLGEKEGAVVILNPHSGEILAMASFPNFDPNWFTRKAKGLGSLLIDAKAPLLNRCIGGLYPAGSIFKMVVAVAGLQTNKINLEDRLYCEGSFKLGKRRFACWDRHDDENLIEAIKDSCNVFFYRLGLLVTARRLYDYAVKLGLGKITQIDLPEELPGHVPSPLSKRLNKFQSWFDGDTANLSIGQGDLLVTPLQVARLSSVFANSGRLVKPYIIQSVDGEDVSVYQKKSTYLPFKREILDAVAEGLRLAVEDKAGTAHILWREDIPLAGKTGTAQMANRKSHAWFSGYFPVKNPRFTITVLLEHAGSSYYACVLAGEIVAKMQEEGLI